jgi:hypothetical protein
VALGDFTRYDSIGPASLRGGSNGGKAFRGIAQRGPELAVPHLLEDLRNLVQRDSKS